MAFRAAWRRLGRWQALAGGTLYSTCEPCLLCSFVITQIGLSRVVFAARATDVPTYRPLLGADLAAAAAWVNAQADWAPLEGSGRLHAGSRAAAHRDVSVDAGAEPGCHYFLYLYGQGQLPYAFAVPGGIGDIAVATLAAVLLVAGLPRDARRRLAYGVWNVLGLADILFVVTTAGRLVTFAPESMAALTRLPLSRLPTFLVPLIIASHVVLGVRLERPVAPTPR